MHWFWRAVIAVGAGTIGGCGVYAIVVTETGAFGGPTLPPMWRWLAAAGFFAGFASSAAVSLGVFWLLVRRRMRFDLETRCRKCDYILRGITEPRCPECGERI